MVQQEIIFAGFGGQGILSMGKFLAHAGMDENLNVSWLPSYGSEMRGGTANCSVIISDKRIGSPIIDYATSLIVMNGPSLDKFENSVVSGGVLILNSEMIERDVDRTDIEVIKIPAQSIATEIGTDAIANMVLLGALVKKTGIVSLNTLLQALKDNGKEKFYEMNKKAIEKGAEYIK